jgi:hypothetical protein
VTLGKARAIINMDFGGTDDARDRRRQSDAIRTGSLSFSHVLAGLVLKVFVCPIHRSGLFICAALIMLDYMTSTSSSSSPSSSRSGSASPSSSSRPPASGGGTGGSATRPAVRSPHGTRSYNHRSSLSLPLFEPSRNPCTFGPTKRLYLRPQPLSAAASPPFATSPPYIEVRS